jgi:hypothetical protein
LGGLVFRKEWSVGPKETKKNQEEKEETKKRKGAN